MENITFLCIISMYCDGKVPLWYVCCILCLTVLFNHCYIMLYILGTVKVFHLLTDVRTNINNITQMMW